MFTIADDVVSDFGNTIGLIFYQHFEECFLTGRRLLFGAHVLPDSITLDFGRVDLGGLRLGHDSLRTIDYNDVNERFNEFIIVFLIWTKILSNYMLRMLTVNK
jgi:hypothetical protein